jgi:hypothetical protein|tara:strand:- start:293 stop:511 length:219 start_codon:yes stop_codon:yes gene_type:complete
LLGLVVQELLQAQVKVQKVLQEQHPLLSLYPLLEEVVAVKVNLLVLMVVLLEVVDMEMLEEQDLEIQVTQVE